MNLFRSRGVDVFEAINKGDWQKVKDNVVQGKVGTITEHIGRKNGRVWLFSAPAMPLSPPPRVLMYQEHGDATCVARMRTFHRTIRCRLLKPW